MRHDVNLWQENVEDGPVVARLAGRIVALLADRTDGCSAALRSDLCTQLESASFDTDPDAMVRVLTSFRRMRVSAAMLADCYIPDVARRLGQGWLDDRIGFADVSQGAARLQMLLRDLSGPWKSDASETPDVGEILLIVPQDEQHTLGAMVAMGQLRRRGVSVCLRFGPSRDELAALMFSRRFDGVLISLSSSEKLAQCKDLVGTVKSFGGGLPVVVGGAVMGLSTEVLAESGADGATNDLSQALIICGIFADHQTARYRA